jgi:hypothetical protein
MDVLHTAKKEIKLNTAEGFYIYKETKKKKTYQLNDKCTAQQNTTVMTFKTTTRYLVSFSTPLASVRTVHMHQLLQVNCSLNM